MRTRATFPLVIGALLLALSWSAGDNPTGVTPAEASTTTVTVSWGPYTVPAASGGVPGSTDNLLDINVQKPCTDCYVTRVVPNLVYADGTTVNFSTGGMLHHMVLLKANGTDATCDGTLIGGLGERILASGNERTVIALPDGYGYYVGPGDAWTLIIDIMNFQSAPQGMYLEFTFDYRPGAEAVKPVTPVWLDVDNCSDSEVAVPAGYSDTHWDWTSNREGNIVAIAGHVHNYGISVAAEDLGPGQYFCTSVAGYANASAYAPAPVTPGDQGHPGAANVIDPTDPDYLGRIEDMSACFPSLHVYAGDTIRLHTQYSAPSSLPDVMGIMIAYMHETTDLPDYDADGVPDISDNCPAWPNPGQAMPPWPIASNDPDCDGFDSASETSIGTYDMTQCPASASANDENPDAWPPDFDDNRVINVSDVGNVLPPFFGSMTGSPDYSQRRDLAPDGVINISDVGKVLPPMFGSSCS